MITDPSGGSLLPGAWKRESRENPGVSGGVGIPDLRGASKWIAGDPDTAPELPPEAKPRVLHNPPLTDVRRLRERLGLTQAEFAKRFGLSRRTVEQWEQGRTVPDRPARILLAVIERDPRVIERVVVGERKS